MFQQLKTKLKAKTEDVLRASVLEPNPEYRMAIGILGVALPPVLVLWGLAAGLQSSISAYYYTRGRDWFVGTLWVLGVFLIFYQYKPQRPGQATSRLRHIRSGLADASLGKFAGVSAVVVALLPTTPPVGGPNQPPIIGMAHGVAAFVLFASLSLFPLLLFSQSRERVRTYMCCGWAMLLLLGLVVVYAFAPDSVRTPLAPLRPVLFLEWGLIWVFGISWFVKGLRPAASEPLTTHRTSAHAST